SGSVSASRMTWMAGNSILGAVEEATKRWLEGDRPATGEFRFVPPPTETLDPEDGTGQPNFAYGYVAESVDVSVDIDTGQVRIDRVVCADDVGKAINPALVIGQIEGAVVQAAGYTVSEDLQVVDGRITNPRFSGYLIPGIGDIPGRIDSILVEHPDPRGPWGVRGMAEMPFIPLAPAVVAAIHDATGVWIDGFPLTPSRVLAALQSAAD
ncbi:MAG: molybdopterin cofactor-binding domain-containing protein, partial [Acidimicrobiia bacterium]